MRSSVAQHLIGLGSALTPDPLLRRWLERHFFTCDESENLDRCLGKFTTIAQASDFAHTHGSNTNYKLDHRAWLERQSTIRAHDYPMLYWLGRVLRDNTALVDLGGSVGVYYYLFQRWLQYPQGLVWMVCELPEVVALGRELTASRDANGLSFTEDRGVIDGCDLLLAAGVLQFLDEPLAELVAAMERPPSHILVNRIALIESGEKYVTLQNTGHAITPMRVDKFDEFCDSMRAAGYEVVDHWRCLESKLWLPLHPECHLEYFHGLYLRLAAA